MYFACRYLLNRSLLLYIVIFSPVGAAQTIKYVDATVLRNNPNNIYFVKVLELALSKTQTNSELDWLQPMDALITQNRQFIELKKGNVDVMWTMHSKAREQQALAIKVPLAFGSYGIRLLVINQHDNRLFDQVDRISQLNKMTALVGRDWPDKQILAENGLNYNDSVSEEDLYGLLNDKAGRYFPRAVTEAKAELANVVSSEQLVVYPKLVLQYPTVMYFYVRKNNLELAKRLEKGLKIALEDGSLKALFFSFSHHKEAFLSFDFSKATLIHLNNSQLDAQSVAGILAMQKQLISDVAKLAQSAH
jgi:hypothetical protein